MNPHLTAIVIDCDSYFASVEQHLQPRLRGRPIAVAPVMVDSSCCIAASYEAKAFGVKTGTGVGEAKQKCPGIIIVPARPAEYIRYHHSVVEAVESCIHVEQVMSIDEMWAWIPLNLRDPATALDIGRRIKSAVARDVSPWIKVSVGIGPNKFLAKMASKMRKPDGLFTILPTDLPHVLHELKLRDLTGIAKSMENRLRALGILTVEQLCSANKEILHAAWNGVLGDRFFHLLRGDELPELESARRSIGHSHVLPPAERHPDSAWDVLCKLLHKAATRLRDHGMVAGSIQLQLGYVRSDGWKAETSFAETNATLPLLQRLTSLWKQRPFPDRPLISVAVTLLRLVDEHNYTPSLFDNSASTSPRNARLDKAVDALQRRYGRQVVFYGNLTDHRDSAPMRISFTHIPDLRIESD